MKVLLVEDEPALCQQLRDRLQGLGFSVEVANDGELGLYCGREYPTDVAVVDLGLPKLSGIEVIRTWRHEGKRFPVLILTARGRWQDKVDGLEAGADDYLVKPFQPEELVARLNALLRRAAGWAHPLLECGPVSLDTATQQVTVGGVPVELTAYEYKILEYLMLHSGDVISKFELTEHIYAQDFERDSNVIEVLIGRLRRKLDPDLCLRPIATLRGRGYRFDLPRSPA